MISEKIICITPNVALDRTLVVPDFAVGHISRIKRAIAVPGGKGLNVMRAIGILKGHPMAMGLLGGHTGRMIAEMVDTDGYPAEWTWYDGETRTCTIIAPPDGNSTVINESGQIEPSDWSNLVDDICRVAESVTTICLCGSLPLGAPDSAPSNLIKRLNAMNKQVWVDSSGNTLQNAIQAKPYAIKVNGDEIGAVLNMTVDSLDSAREAGKRLVDDGIPVIVITLGADGAMLVTQDLVAKATPPQITPVDPIGSGDSVLAGLVTALAEGDDFTEAIRAGVASGTVNALYAGGAQFPYEHYQTILAETNVEIL
jgi:tagatose 6-phosphate kinase